MIMAKERIETPAIEAPMATNNWPTKMLRAKEEAPKFKFKDENLGKTGVRCPALHNESITATHLDNPNVRRALINYDIASAPADSKSPMTEGKSTFVNDHMVLA